MSNTLHIAIIDDDINMRKALESSLVNAKEKFDISVYKSAKEALANLDDSVDLLIVDINMPKINGIELLEKLDGKYSAIIITGSATLNLTVQAMRVGASDFLQKPFETSTLLKSIKRVSSFDKKTKNKPKIKTSNDDFYAKSPKLDEVLKIASKVALSDASTLLLGESGSGKELFANYIHNNSNRAGKPFIAINMAAIPNDLIESELFGYEKGAFTDAKDGKIGKFEMACGGSIFLDEIAEMPIGLQAKLLRALQEKEIHRLGGTKTIKIDIRVISATNANLLESIKNKTFREDLYYRLNTIPINIPPLRERVEEIIPIAEKYLKGFSKMYSDMIPKILGSDAKKTLIEYKWPGNIRELKSVIERSFILSDNEEITSNDLFLDSRSVGKNINDLEKDLYEEAYEKSNQDIKECAILLDISDEVVCKKLKQFKII